MTFPSLDLTSLVHPLNSAIATERPSSEHATERTEEFSEITSFSLANVRSQKTNSPCRGRSCALLAPPTVTRVFPPFRKLTAQNREGGIGPLPSSQIAVVTGINATIRSTVLRPLPIGGRIRNMRLINIFYRDRCEFTRKFRFYEFRIFR